MIEESSVDNKVSRDFKYPKYLSAIFGTTALVTAYNAKMAYQFDDGSLIIKVILLILLLYATYAHIVFSYVCIKTGGVHIQKSILSSRRLLKWSEISAVKVDKKAVSITENNGAVTKIHLNKIIATEREELISLLQEQVPSQKVSQMSGTE